MSDADVAALQEADSGQVLKIIDTWERERRERALQILKARLQRLPLPEPAVVDRMKSIIGQLQRSIEKALADEATTNTETMSRDCDEACDRLAEHVGKLEDAARRILSYAQLPPPTSMEFANWLSEEHTDIRDLMSQAELMAKTPAEIRRVCNLLDRTSLALFIIAGRLAKQIGGSAREAA
jgi:hypothetical protein